MLFMVPSAFVTFRLNFLIHAAPSLAGDTNRASPVFIAVAPSDPEIKLSPNTSVTAAKSCIDQPTVLKMDDPTLIASNRSDVVVFACACAWAKIFAASLAVNPCDSNTFKVFPNPDVTSDRSVAVPAASDNAGSNISADFFASNPCLAKFNVASAASSIVKTEFAAAFFNAPSRSPVAHFVSPIVDSTSFSVLSTLPKF